MPITTSSHLRRLAPLLLAVTVLPGCFFSRSRTNPELSPELASQIIPAQSTAADVTELLGAPNEVVQLGLRTAWRYEHTVEKQSAAFLAVSRRAQRVLVEGSGHQLQLERPEIVLEAILEVIGEVVEVAAIRAAEES